ncbi:MAG: hypothetical protein L0Z50_42755 [Verrucomicrobiales bacterium]|nr:hypothetical protein [Verrucomicrobiales bacterium]
MKLRLVYPPKLGIKPGLSAERDSLPMNAEERLRNAVIGYILRARF